MFYFEDELEPLDKAAADTPLSRRKNLRRYRGKSAPPKLAAQ
jgi:hypothetical protein